MKFTQSKKFRHGSVSVALTVVIIAAVILVNALFTALSSRFNWYVDMTAEQLYTLSDEAQALLDTVPTDREVTIIFCSSKNKLEGDPSLRYPLYTVTEIAKRYPNIKVEYKDWLYYRQELEAYYEPTSGQTLNGYSIIVTSTFEAVDPEDGILKPRKQSRVYALNALYTYDSTGSAIIGYNGEQRLISGIMAVTQVETPVACFTTDHGETPSTALLQLLYESGYELRELSLSQTHQTIIDPETQQEKSIPTEEYMKDCRLLLIFDPQKDFYAADGADQLKVLEKQMQKAECAVLFFFDYNTPELPYLEAFMKEWGVEIARHPDPMTATNVNYLIKDPSKSLDAEGLSMLTVPAEAGLGYSITKQLSSADNTVFQYAGAIRMPENTNWILNHSEPDEEGKVYTYGAYYANGATRALYDVFNTTNKAYAEANTKKLDAQAPFKLMTVTREILSDGGSSYLLACSSTEFASAASLGSNYGNRTVLIRAFHAMGGAQVSVALDCKYFTDTEIESITAAAANRYTVVLVAVPTIAIFVTGVVIMVRRKYA